MIVDVPDTGLAELEARIALPFLRTIVDLGHVCLRLMVWIGYYKRDRHMSIEGMRARKATKTRLPNALQYFPHTLFCTSLRLVEGATEREPSLNPWSVRNIWSLTKLINQSTATSKRCHSLGPLFLLDNNLD
jgi:hypothetical protein